MKKISFKLVLGLICIAASFSSCDKENKADNVTFEVETDALTYLVGEPITFDMKGSADFIIFYSGEYGSEYKYANEPKIYPATSQLSFSTRLEGGAQLENILKVKYSKNFLGDYTREGVDAATWIDITDKFVIPIIIEAITTPSGKLEMSELYSSNNEIIYFAYEYTMEAFDPLLNNERTSVYVYDFDIKGISSLGEESILNQASVNWAIVRYGVGFDDDLFGPNNNTTRLVLKTSPEPPAWRQAWAISPGIKNISNINLGVDKGLVLKNYIDPFPSSYQYSYSEPGEYEVTLMAANSAVKGQKIQAKTIKLKIESTGDVDTDGGSTTPIEKEDW